jgi:transcriptional regulator with XRE-family HTH domain
MEGVSDDDTQLSSRVGERLRALRRQRNATLADVAAITGLSQSLLSRLESGKRRPTLEALLPLARAYRVPLDDLVGAPDTGDPRVHLRPRSYRGRTIVPLSNHPGPLQAYKQVLPGRPDGAAEPVPVTHDGYEWFYVLSGRLRLILGERDVVLAAGEVAEFDTHVPHWFGSADHHPVEILNLFGPQGQRAHTAVTDVEP